MSAEFRPARSSTSAKAGALPSFALSYGWQAGRAYQPFVPVAQSIEQTRPKRQAAGETPVGDAKSEWVIG